VHILRDPGMTTDSHPPRLRRGQRMHPTSSGRTPLPDAWARVLTEVEEAIAGALEDARRREQALGPAEPAVPPDFPSPAADSQGWPSRLEQAEAQASAADETLRTAEDGLRRWREQAEAVARKLADWDGRTV
jgi:hypothetical protein